MGLLDSKTECCGSNLKNERISFIGLLTFSTPIVFILFIPSILLQTISKNNILTIIFNSNITLINEATILPNLKCHIAAKTLGMAPVVSSVLFKAFNLILLFLIFFFVFILTYLAFSI